MSARRPTMSIAMLDDLKTKTQALKRLATEKEQAVLSTQKEKLALAEMRASGASSDVIRRQEAKARERQLAATNLRLRMATAVEELKRVMEIEPGLSHTPEYGDARQTLRETVRLFVN